MPLLSCWAVWPPSQRWGRLAALMKTWARTPPTVMRSERTFGADFDCAALSSSSVNKLDFYNLKQSEPHWSLLHPGQATAALWISWECQAEWRSKDCKDKPKHQRVELKHPTCISYANSACLNNVFFSIVPDCVVIILSVRYLIREDLSGLC